MVFLAMLLGLTALLAMPPAANHLLLRKPRAKAAVAMGFALVVTGSMHFTRTGDFVALAPSWLPARETLVRAAGAFEIVLGFAFVFEGSRPAAGWAAAAYFLLLLPVHVEVARGTATLPYLPQGRWFYWLRIPAQFLYAGWALWCRRPPPGPRSDSRRR